jgi:hypothetical protein
VLLHNQRMQAIRGSREQGVGSRGDKGDKGEKL